MSTSKLSLLTETQKQQALSDIIDFFATERDEEIGIIAAEDILDLFTEHIGKEIYNKGVEDTLAFIKDRNTGTVLDAEVTLKKE